MNYLQLYKNLPWDKRMMALSVALAAVPLAIYLLLSPQAPSTPKQDAAGIETHIPRGFVLVPIDIENYESLDSVFGLFGVVDLYQKEGPVARNVRLLRAPNNPSRFAVLIAEKDTERLLKNGSVFSVVVKPNQKAGTEFVKPQTSKRPRAITYEGG